MINDVTISTVPKPAPGSRGRQGTENVSQQPADIVANLQDSLAREGDGKAEAGKDATKHSQDNIRAAVKEVNDYIKDVRRDLVFQVDESTHELVVKVKDRESGDVIRQIPSEEVLQLVQRLKDIAERQTSAAGVLVKDSA